MTRFAQQFAASARSNLMLEFAEPVGYYNRDGDALRTIDAIVERDVEIISEAGVPGQATVIRVANDALQGISSTEIDTGGDEIAYALRVDETPHQRKAIVRVLSTENGLVRFMVQ